MSAATMTNAILASRKTANAARSRGARRPADAAAGAGLAAPKPAPKPVPWVGALWGVTLDDDEAEFWNRRTRAFLRYCGLDPDRPYRVEPDPETGATSIVGEAIDPSKLPPRRPFADLPPAEKREVYACVTRTLSDPALRAHGRFCIVVRRSTHDEFDWYDGKGIWEVFTETPDPKQPLVCVIAWFPSVGEQGRSGWAIIEEAGENKGAPGALVSGAGR